ncbi:MAG: serine hydrolase, partial [Gemmataceae bacterium]
MKATRPWLLAALLVILVPASLRADPTIAAQGPYAEVAKKLEAFIEREVRDKRLPALSIALVDDQKIVWARGFGFQDPEKQVPATAETVYRVGSVSKLFTDIAIMQLVEAGRLDLDEPVTKYQPDFKVVNRYDRPVTLRQMMAHRSGLIREPAAGNYFDPEVQSLAEMVKSLNGTRLVYEPETRIKYSNAAIATVGYVLEKTQREPFAKYVKRRVLEPLEMRTSAFEPQPDVVKNLAKAQMWTYHGREFPAPTFELGMAPAGSMYSTVLDLGHFLSVLFEGGKPVLKPESLKEMLTPQFAKEGDKEGFGIGFHLTEFQGKRRAGHGGAIYGFATELSFLPEEKLGVVVVTSRDVANAVTNHIADEALTLMLAARAKKRLPEIKATKPIESMLARQLAGQYRSEDRILDLEERDGRLWLWYRGLRAELRQLDDQTLITDDLTHHGARIKLLDGGKLELADKEFMRIPDQKPAACPEKWRPYLGEYGWDHNILYILEKDGKLHALIEWVCLYPLEEEADGVFKFPEYGLYHGEKIVFRGVKEGKASAAIAAGITFQRRINKGEDGTFRIKPVKPLPEIIKQARMAKPPTEKGNFRVPDMVELNKLDDTIKLDIRYASDNNFLGGPVYPEARAFMQ